jgi:hypothetical protein
MSPRQPLFGKILVPLKSSLGLCAASSALGLAKASGGEVIVLHIEDDAENATEVRHTVDLVESQGKALGVPITRMVRRGPVGPVIREVAEGTASDLVILSRRPDSKVLESVLTALQDPSPGVPPCTVMLVPTLAVRESHSDPPTRPDPSSDCWRYGVG